MHLSSDDLIQVRGGLMQICHGYSVQHLEKDNGVFNK